MLGARHFARKYIYNKKAQLTSRLARDSAATWRIRLK